MIPGTVPWLLEELGIVLDDYDEAGALRLTAGSTTSQLQVERAVNLLDSAQQSLFTHFLYHGANRTLLSRKATVAQSSADTQEFVVPSRAIAMSRLRDSDMNDVDDADAYMPLRSALDLQGWGYRVERHGTRIRLVGHEADASLTYYAYVLEEPAHLTYGTVGQAETSSTCMTLASTATHGRRVEEDDYYIGSEFAITSGTGVGTLNEVTDYAHATRVLDFVDSWSLGATDTYSTFLALPRVAWRAVVLRAALRASRKVWPMSDEARADIQQEYQTNVEAALKFLKHPAVGAIGRIRVGEVLQH